VFVSKARISLNDSKAMKYAMSVMDFDPPVAVRGADVA